LVTFSERQKILKIAISPEYVDLSPRQIVPRLADKGEFVASESSFYRILEQEKNAGPSRKIKAKNSPSSKRARCDRPKPGVELGYNLFEIFSAWSLLLSLYVYGHLLAKNSWVASP